MLQSELNVKGIVTANVRYFSKELMALCPQR